MTEWTFLLGWQGHNVRGLENLRMTLPSNIRSWSVVGQTEKLTHREAIKIDRGMEPSWLRGPDLSCLWVLAAPFPHHYYVKYHSLCPIKSSFWNQLQFGFYHFQQSRDLNGSTRSQWPDIFLVLKLHFSSHPPLLQQKSAQPPCCQFLLVLSIHTVKTWPIVLPLQQLCS